MCMYARAGPVGQAPSEKPAVGEVQGFQEGAVTRFPTSFACIMNALLCLDTEWYVSVTPS